jgi:hypothetical protein
MTNTSFFARSAVAAACAALTIAAAPAFASHDAGSHDTANTQKLEVRKDSKGHVRYCAVKPAITGSITDTTVCNTIAGWKAQGVEINPDTGAATVAGA